MQLHIYMFVIRRFIDFVIFKYQLKITYDLLSRSCSMYQIIFKQLHIFAHTFFNPKSVNKILLH